MKGNGLKYDKSMKFQTSSVHISANGISEFNITLTRLRVHTTRCYGLV
jgi:hypothetical protein